MHTFAFLRMIVCQHVVQHLTEALIATANQNYTCTTSGMTQRLHLRRHFHLYKHTISRIFAPSTCSTHLRLIISRSCVRNKDLTTHLRSYCKNIHFEIKTVKDYILQTRKRNLWVTQQTGRLGKLGVSSCTSDWMKQLYRRSTISGIMHWSLANPGKQCFSYCIM